MLEGGWVEGKIEYNLPSLQMSAKDPKFYFGYMVFGKCFPLYEISAIWSIFTGP